MKPTSIIFLIVSAILIVGGFLICTVAKIDAKRENIPLYDEQVNDDNKIEHTEFFEADSVYKVRIEVDEADINVICNANENKITALNFVSSEYSCKVQNKTVEMVSGFNIFSLADIAQGNVHFKGIRQYVKYGFSKSGHKEVNVYVSDKSNIKSFDISTKSGNVTISDYTNSSDVVVNVGSGNVILKNINTDSKIDVSIGTGDVKMENTVCNKMAVKITDGDADIGGSANNITVDIENGDAKMVSNEDFTKYNFDITTISGTIDLFGTNKKGVFNYIDALVSRKFKANMGNGNVVLASSGDYSPIFEKKNDSSAEETTQGEEIKAP